MTSEEFVAALVQVVHEASVTDVIKSLQAPSGRRSDGQQLALMNWFNRISEEDRQRVRQAVERAVHSAIFGTLCVLDGVRAIEDGPAKSELRLLAVNGSTTEWLNSPNAECLHDIYQGHVYERVFGRKG